MKRNPAAEAGYQVKRKTHTGMPVGQSPGLSELSQEEVIYDVIGSRSVAGWQCDPAG